MKHATLLGIAGVAALCSAAPAFAQANRTFVSGQGADSNPCSLSAPCRSFAQALTQTNPGGEIAVLDTAGYGQVTINKAVSIVNQDGVEAGVTVTSGDGITVAAGASDTVNLRGLTVVGGGGNNGITFSSGKSLIIDKCQIRGFTGGGIAVVNPNPINVNLTVTDTTVSNNSQGVMLKPGAITLNATLSRLHATGNGTGVAVIPSTGAIVRGQVVDSLFDGNGTAIVATTSPPLMSGATVIVDNSKVFSNSPSDIPLSVSGNGAAIIVGRSQFDFVDQLVSTSNLGIFQTYNNNQALMGFATPTTF